MTRIAASFVIAAALAASVAIAQPLAQDRFSNTPERPVRVQLSINFFVPGSINEASEETSKVREQARRGLVVALHYAAKTLEQRAIAQMTQ